MLSVNIVFIIKISALYLHLNEQSQLKDYDYFLKWLITSLDPTSVILII